MSRPYPSHLRQSSVGPGFGAANSHQQQQHSPALVARINEKKIELENLKQLRDLSGGLAQDLQALEDKLRTLTNGTEAVATVLANWHNVLRAISMASMKIPIPKGEADEQEKPVDGEDNEGKEELPQMLVRVPTNFA